MINLSFLGLRFFGHSMYTVYNWLPGFCWIRQPLLYWRNPRFHADFIPIRCESLQKKGGETVKSRTWCGMLIQPLWTGPPESSPEKMANPHCISWFVDQLYLYITLIGNDSHPFKFCLWNLRSGFINSPLPSAWLGFLTMSGSGSGEITVCDKQRPDIWIYLGIDSPKYQIYPSQTWIHGLFSDLNGHSLSNLMFHCY